MTAQPILMLGAGRMGGAMARGWLKAGAFAAADLAFISRTLREDAQAVVAAGAQASPQDLSCFQTVVLAVKPQVWREATSGLAERLAPDAVIVSVMAGVTLADLVQAFGGRRSARTIPTTGVAVADGVTSLYADDAEALRRAHVLFDPLGLAVDVGSEDELHAATAVSGSAPAYLYAYMEALEAAGVAAGLSDDAARRLVRATVASAAVLLRETGEEPAELRRQVTSPNGVTHAALQPLMADGDGFPHLMREAVQAAIRRSRELGAPATKA
jgi:pyrroline-5-carboxylate reductase